MPRSATNQTYRSPRRHHTSWALLLPLPLVIQSLCNRLFQHSLRCWKRGQAPIVASGPGGRSARLVPNPFSSCDDEGCRLHPLHFLDVRCQNRITLSKRSGLFSKGSERFFERVGGRIMLRSDSTLSLRRHRQHIPPSSQHRGDFGNHIGTSCRNQEHCGISTCLSIDAGRRQ